MKKFNVLPLLISIMLFSLFSCSEMNQTTEASFEYQLESVFSQTIRNRGVEKLVAQMTIFSHIDQSTTTMDWNVTFNEDTKTVTSNMSVAQAPGMYDYTLVIKDGTKEYIGIARNHDLAAIKTVTLSVRPVIGDNNINITVLSNGTESKLKFSYPAAELTNIADPQIGIVLDGADEVIIALNKAIGSGEIAMNVPVGEHSLLLNLYDGSFLIGTSIPDQEKVVVVEGEDVKMDIIPLFSEAVFLTSIDGGEANINMYIPNAIINEAGSLSNLKAIFRLSGSRNPLIEQEMVITQLGNSYHGALKINNLFYDTANINIEFIKIAEDELIGHALRFDLPINENSSVSNIGINIYKRTVVSGNILGIVGVNVLDAANQPLSGAEIYLDGKPVGITGSLGSLGSSYFRFWEKSGNYTLTAIKNHKRGSIDISVTPLSINNFVINCSTFTQGTTLLLQESFEGTHQYTANQFDDGGGDYNSLYSTNAKAAPWGVILPAHGADFWVMEDLDDLTDNPLNPDTGGYVIFDTKDVSVYDSVMVKFLIVADTFACFESSDDSVKFQYAFDGNIAPAGAANVGEAGGGVYTTFAGFYGNHAMNATRLYEDTDNDGSSIGDGGTEIIEVFQEFTYTFPTNGATNVSIRISCDIDGSEEVGFDNIRIYGIN